VVPVAVMHVVVRIPVIMISIVEVPVVGAPGVPVVRVIAPVP